MTERLTPSITLQNDNTIKKEERSQSAKTSYVPEIEQNVVGLLKSSIGIKNNSAFRVLRENDVHSA